MITLNLLIILLCAVRLISAVSIFQLAENNTEINELNRHRHLIDTSLRKVSASPIFLNEMTAQQQMPTVPLYAKFGKKVKKNKVNILGHPQKPNNIMWFLQWVELLFYGPQYYHVQIGAFASDDDQDFFATFLKGASWSKLMIEPQPHVYQRLTEFASKQSNMLTYQAAVCEVDKTATFYRMSEDIDIYTGKDKRSGKVLPYWVSQAASLNKGHLMKAKSAFKEVGLVIEDYIVEQTVPCLTAMSILKEKNVDPNLVVSLSVDAEGYDDYILLSTDLNAIRPAFIFFECIHWYRDTQRLSKVMAHLTKHGYMWWKIGYEIAAVRLGQ